MSFDSTSLATLHSKSLLTYRSLNRRSYSDHVINSLFSQIRSWARSDYRTPAAYATAREQCAKSLRAVLTESSAISKLIDLHSPLVTPAYPVTARDKDDETTTAFESATASHEIRSR